MRLMTPGEIDCSWGMEAGVAVISCADNVSVCMVMVEVCQKDFW